MNKTRLDKLILIRKITDSREKAAKMIKEGQIKINGKTVQKSSKEFEDNCVIEIEEGYKEYVGRGA
ncbi:MAG: S4 domain-containing protein, partial [Candidatus Gracilibacteria bacterium]|nr:S4 domain-containing protein [Candidatus Gracilibacteria bacterium]